MLLVVILFVAVGIDPIQAAVTLSSSKSVVKAGEGGFYQITCTSSSGTPTWTAEPPSAMPDAPKGSVSASGKQMSTLKFGKIKASNTGKFTCQDASASTGAAFDLDVLPVTVLESEYDYETQGMVHGKATMNCKVKDTQATGVKYTWSRYGKAVKDVKIRKIHWNYTELVDGTLEIIRPVRELSGVWTCRAEYTTGGQKTTLDTEVNYWAKPYVIPFRDEESDNRPQDDDAILKCHAAGHPLPTVAWYRENILIEANERVELGNVTYFGDTFKGARLKIIEVDFDDVGDYECVASSIHWPGHEYSRTVHVRVRSKLAALWPGLGILGIVMIVTTIVIITECKKDWNEDDDNLKPVLKPALRRSPSSTIN